MLFKNVPNIICLDFEKLQLDDTTLAWLKRKQEWGFKFVSFNAVQEVGKTLKNSLYILPPDFKRRFLARFFNDHSNANNLRNFLQSCTIDYYTSEINSLYRVNICTNEALQEYKNFNISVPENLQNEEIERFIKAQAKFLLLLQIKGLSFEEFVIFVTDPNITCDHDIGDHFDISPYHDLEAVFDRSTPLRLDRQPPPLILDHPPTLADDLYVTPNSSIINPYLLVEKKKELAQVTGISTPLKNKCNRFNLLLEAYLNNMADNPIIKASLDSMPKKEKYACFSGKYITVNNNHYYIDLKAILHKGDNASLSKRALDDRDSVKYLKLKEEYTELLLMLVDEEDPFLLEDLIQCLRVIGYLVGLSCLEPSLIELFEIDEPFRPLFITLLRFIRGPSTTASLQQRSAILSANKEDIDKLLMTIIIEKKITEDLNGPAFDMIFAWEFHRRSLKKSLRKLGDDKHVINEPLKKANEAIIFLIDEFLKLPDEFLKELAPKSTKTNREALLYRKKVLTLSDLKFEFHRELILYRKRCHDQGESDDSKLIQLIDRAIIALLQYGDTDLSFDPLTGKTYKSMDLNPKGDKEIANLLAQGELHDILKKTPLARPVKEGTKERKFTRFYKYPHFTEFQNALYPHYKAIYESAQKLWISFPKNDQLARQAIVGEFLTGLENSFRSPENTQWMNKTFLGLNAILNGYFTLDSSIIILQNVRDIMSIYEENLGYVEENSEDVEENLEYVEENLDDDTNFWQLQKHYSLKLEQLQFLGIAPNLFNKELRCDYFSNPDENEYTSLIEAFWDKLTEKDSKGSPSLSSREVLALKNILLAGFSQDVAINVNDLFFFNPQEFLAIESPEHFNLCFDLLIFVMDSSQPESRFKLFEKNVPSIQDQRKCARELYQAIIENSKAAVEEKFFNKFSSLGKILRKHRASVDEFLQQTIAAHI